MNKNLTKIKSIAALLTLLASVTFLTNCNTTTSSNEKFTEKTGLNEGNDTDPGGPQCKSKEYYASPENVLEELKTVRRGAESVSHRINDVVDSFGGIYIDEDGIFNVMLTNPGDEGIARETVSNETSVRKQKAFQNGAIKINEAQFTFRDLAAWRELSTAYLLTSSEYDYVLSTHISHRNNKVAIGIDESKWYQENLDTLEDYMVNVLKLPRASFMFEREYAEIDDFEIEESDIDLSTLSGSIRDKQRPLLGGLNTRRGSSLCTMGFLGTLGDIEVFVTNSHCTDNPHRESATKIYQGSSSRESDLAGIEVLDGPFSYATCIRSNRDCWPCRWSDSAIIAVAGDDVPTARGYIAKTTRKSTEWLVEGGTTIDKDDPVFTVVDVEFNLFEGMTLQKVGAKSGWSSGDIIGTCVDSSRSSHQIILQCQYRAKYATSGGGTSGSPVFTEIIDDYPNADVANPVALVGIHRASSNRESTAGYSSFSPIEGVMKDFEDLEGLTAEIIEN